MAAAARHASANEAGVSAGSLTRYSVRSVLIKHTHCSQSDQSEVDRVLLHHLQEWAGLLNK